MGRSQVLPYLQGCAGRGHEITVLSCEKSERFQRHQAAVAALCEGSHLRWHPTTYHQQPPVLSSIYDSRQLTRKAVQLHSSCNFDLVHCRSYIPVLTGLKLKHEFRLPLIFDMRGFWADERVDGRNWNIKNPLYWAVYRFFKGLEARALVKADAIVSLTNAAREALLARQELGLDPARIYVIPCCVDFEHFRLSSTAGQEARAELGIPQSASVLAYLGSLGGNYMLEEMLGFFKVYGRRNPAAKFLFITSDAREPIIEAAARHSIDSEDILIRAATREEVPALVAAANAGIAFKQPSFSAIACSPTKLGEMLALGIPVCVNSGVGDVEEIISRTGGGAVVHSFDEASFEPAVDALDNSHQPKSRMRAAAKDLLDLSIAVDCYDQIYRDLVPAKSDRLAPAAPSASRERTFE